MLTIRAEIKKEEQKADGTYNVKIRFTLNRKIRRLSTSFFVGPAGLTKSGKLKNNTAVAKEVNSLVLMYQTKCNTMQVDMNNLSLDYIFKRLRFDEQKAQGVDFIDFSRKWVKEVQIKSSGSYVTVINSIISFIGREHLNVTEITVSFLRRYADYLIKRRDERKRQLIKAGKRVPSNRTVSLYLGCLRHLYKEAQRKYNDFDDNLILIPHCPFDNFKIPRQEATRKRALSKEMIRKIYALPYKNMSNGYKGTCRYNLAKDCFILSFCLIGMNSVDMFNVKEITENRLVYNRAKTKDRRLDQARMEVDIPDIILPLLEKYRDKKGKRIFNFYHYYSDRSAFNKAINGGLKEIGKELDIDDLEYYAARHSWATIALNKAGVDKYTVHAALNHVDESMRVTDIYIERDFVNENMANRKVLNYVFDGLI